MVNLIDGKMKSREGNVIDGDNLISELIESIMPEITQKLIIKRVPKKCFKYCTRSNSLLSAKISCT